MPALSCNCQQVIVKEGLAHFIEESLDGIFAYAAYTGVKKKNAITIVATILAEGMYGQIPERLKTNRELTIYEQNLVIFCLHTLQETKNAGYSPRAFHDTLVQDVMKVEHL